MRRLVQRIATNDYYIINQTISMYQERRVEQRKARPRRGITARATQAAAIFVIAVTGKKKEERGTDGRGSATRAKQQSEGQ